MTSGWKNESQRHAMASKGIKTGNLTQKKVVKSSKPKKYSSNIEYNEIFLNYEKEVKSYDWDSIKRDIDKTDYDDEYIFAYSSDEFPSFPEEAFDEYPHPFATCEKILRKEAKAHDIYIKVDDDGDVFMKNIGDFNGLER